MASLKVSRNTSNPLKLQDTLNPLHICVQTALTMGRQSYFLERGMVKHSELASHTFRIKRDSKIQTELSSQKTE